MPDAYRLVTIVRSATRHAPGLLALTLLGLAPAVRAELSIQITQGVSTPIPIAVVPFAVGAGPLPLDPAAVIGADLERSGRFQTLARSSMLRAPTSAGEIDFGEWRLLKTDFVVIGRVPAAAAIEFELYSVLTGQRLAAFTVPVTNGAWRLTAHRIADMIYERIVGVRGAFATRIAYVAVDGQAPRRHFRLVVADADGENRHTIVDSREPIMSPAWSPDGTRLAYVSFEGGVSGIYVQTLASGERRRVSAREGINGAPAWSPDGTRVALTLSTRDGNVDVYLLDLASGAYLRVTDDPAIDTEPCFTPDGRSLYFTSDRAGRPQVYRIALSAGAHPQRVTFEGSYNARPRLTPDGSQLAVVTLDQGAYHVAVLDPQTGRGRILTSGSLDVSPSFAPNGQTLIYSSRDRGHGVLATVALDGAVASRIASDEGDVREPAWSPFPPAP